MHKISAYSFFSEIAPFYEQKRLYEKTSKQLTSRERRFCQLFGGVRCSELKISNYIDVDNTETKVLICGSIHDRGITVYCNLQQGNKNVYGLFYILTSTIDVIILLWCVLCLWKASRERNPPSLSHFKSKFFVSSFSYSLNILSNSKMQKSVWF